MQFIPYRIPLYTQKLPFAVSLNYKIRTPVGCITDTRATQSMKHHPCTLFKDLGEKHSLKDIGKEKGEKKYWRKNSVG